METSDAEIHALTSSSNQPSSPSQLEVGTYALASSSNQPSSVDDNAPIGDAYGSDSEHESSASESVNSGSDYCPEPNFETASTSTRKRQYNMTARTPRRKSKSVRREVWDNGAKDIIDNLSSMRCCRKLNCFQTANEDYLKHKIVSYRSKSTDERKTLLRSMVGSDNCFMFDGRRVCSTFLLLAFRFARPMQASVKDDVVSCHSSDVSFTKATSCDGQIASLSPSTNISDPKRSPHRDAIVSFLERLAESTADRMPDKTEWHLPFFRRRLVYDLFRKEFQVLYPQDALPSTNYFLATWKARCFQIKVRKHSRFTKCETCEELRDALATAVSHRRCTLTIRDKITNHLEIIRRERLEYRKRRETAILHPRDYVSMIIDGADQSAYGLPKLAVTTKGEKGHALKVRLIGILTHSVPNKLHLYTLTEEYETGANHIIECIHRLLNAMGNSGTLPRRLFIQMDNCSRENKNRFVFAYLESLVEVGLFNEVLVGFLPVGHTHEDIDQSFSTTSTRLRTAQAITLSDLHAELRQCYNNRTSVEHIDSMVNWSGLCELEGCLTNVQGFTQFQYFRFLKDNMHPSENGNRKSTKCQVRVLSTDSWRNLVLSDESKSFIKFVPDLRNTPALDVRCPDGGTKVTQRIKSVEGRINCRLKIAELMRLRDSVFRSRKEPFAWDVNTCVELSSQNNALDQSINDSQPTSTRITNAERVEHNSGDIHTNDFDYNVDSFVIVNPEGAQGEFWIAQIIGVDRKEASSSTECSLKVHWFEAASGTTDPLSAKYKPAFIMMKTTSSATPWVDDISDSSVIVNFAALTKANTIPMAVRRHIKTI